MSGWTSTSRSARFRGALDPVRGSDPLCSPYRTADSAVRCVDGRLCVELVDQLGARTPTSPRMTPRVTVARSQAPDRIAVRPSGMRGRQADFQCEGGTDVREGNRKWVDLQSGNCRRWERQGRRRSSALRLHMPQSSARPRPSAWPRSSTTPGCARRNLANVATPMSLGSCDGSSRSESRPCEA
jgi:hypothetical protein